MIRNLLVAAVFCMPMVAFAQTPNAPAPQPAPKAIPLPGSIWSYTWPVLLIAIGLAVILGKRRHWTSDRRPREDEEEKK